MITTFHSYPDCASLLTAINDRYRINATKLYLYRDMIGSVYFLESGRRKYVFKLFRREATDQALQSLEIISYLRGFDYPVVPIVPLADSDGSGALGASGDSGKSRASRESKSGESGAHGLGALYMMLEMPEGQRAGVLYEFVEGSVPDFTTATTGAATTAAGAGASDITAVGRQIGRMHNLMSDYPRPLIKRGKGFYIDRYIKLMQEFGYSATKTSALAAYGDRLWRSMEQLPAGFCHGDLHSGNMIKTGNDRFILFDFDVASHAYPVIDAATLSDKTNFNRLDDSAYDNTRRMFERFYQGYSRERTLSDREIAAIFDFIAIRHYELNATITEYRLPLRGTSWMSDAVFDEQYEWLMRWREMCGS